MDSEAFVNKSRLIVGNENPSRLCVSSRSLSENVPRKTKKTKNCITLSHHVGK